MSVASKFVPHSLKAGASASDRALFSAILAANNPPTLAAQGILIGPHSHVDLVVSETAGGTCDLKVWWFYQDAGIWVEDLAIGSVAVAANSTAGAVGVPSAATRVYIEVLNLAGGCEISGWAIGLGALGRVGG